MLSQVFYHRILNDVFNTLISADGSPTTGNGGHYSLTDQNNVNNVDWAVALPTVGAVAGCGAICHLWASRLGGVWGCLCLERFNLMSCRDQDF